MVNAKANVVNAKANVKRNAPKGPCPEGTNVQPTTQVNTAAPLPTAYGLRPTAYGYRSFFSLFPSRTEGKNDLNV